MMDEILLLIITTLSVTPALYILLNKRKGRVTLYEIETIITIPVCTFLGIGYYYNPAVLTSQLPRLILGFVTLGSLWAISFGLKRKWGREDQQ